MLHSICQQIWKTQQWPQDWTRSVFIPIPKKGNAKECSNYRTITLISRASKVMLKILQARLQQHVHHELPDIQAGFRKGRGKKDQIANICWITEKAREFQKNICFTDYAKDLNVWSTINCGKFWERLEYQTTWPASWEICMQVKKQQLELDMEQQTTQSCPTLCDPMDSSLPSSSVHGIFQAIVLEWIAISFSRVSSQPRDRTWVSRIVDRCFTIWAMREVHS